MRIHLPDETWLAFLEPVPRRCLGNKVDLVGSRYFARLAQDCLHSQFKHITIGDLQISIDAKTKRAKLKKLNSPAIGDKIVVPIADVDMPANIRGCDRIYICNLDAIGLQLLARMRSLFHGVALDFANVDCGDPLEPTAVVAARVTDNLRNVLPLTSGPVELIEAGQVSLPILRNSFPVLFFDTTCLDVCISADITNDPSTALLLADWLFTSPPPPLIDVDDDASPPFTPHRLLRLYLIHLKFENDIDVTDEEESLAIELAIFQQIFTILAQRFADQTRQQASPFWLVLQLDSDSVTFNAFDSTIQNGQTGEQLIVWGNDDRLVMLNCAIGVAPEWVAQRKQLACHLYEQEKKGPSFLFD